MKNITEKIRNPRTLYTMLLTVFMIAETTAIMYLKRLGRYAGYYVAGMGRYDRISFPVVYLPLIIISLLVFVPLWDLYKNKKAGVVFPVIAVTVLLWTALNCFDMTKSAVIHTWHNFVMADKRYEIEYVEDLSVYKYESGEKDGIVYIFGDDMETDGFINYINSVQPLKIVRISESDAQEYMDKNYISSAPAVVIYHDGNGEVLQGREEIINLLGVKLHNYKRNNIFFY